MIEISKPIQYLVLLETCGNLLWSFSFFFLFFKYNYFTIFSFLAGRIGIQQATGKQHGKSL